MIEQNLHESVRAPLGIRAHFSEHPQRFLPGLLFAPCQKLFQEVFRDVPLFHTKRQQNLVCGPSHSVNIGSKQFVQLRQIAEIAMVHRLASIVII